MFAPDSGGTVENVLLIYSRALKSGAPRGWREIWRSWCGAVKSAVGLGPNGRGLDSLHVPNRALPAGSTVLELSRVLSRKLKPSLLFFLGPLAVHLGWEMGRSRADSSECFAHLFFEPDLRDPWFPQVLSLREPHLHLREPSISLLRDPAGEGEVKQRFPQVALARILSRKLK